MRIPYVCFWGGPEFDTCFRILSDKSNSYSLFLSIGKKMSVLESSNKDGIVKHTEKLETYLAKALFEDITGMSLRSISSFRKHRSGVCKCSPPSYLEVFSYDYKSNCTTDIDYCMKCRKRRP